MQVTDIQAHGLKTSNTGRDSWARVQAKDNLNGAQHLVLGFMASKKDDDLCVFCY